MLGQQALRVQRVARVRAGQQAQQEQLVRAGQLALREVQARQAQLVTVKLLLTTFFLEDKETLWRPQI